MNRCWKCLAPFLAFAGVVASTTTASPQSPVAAPGYAVALVADSLPPIYGIAVAPSSFGAFAGDIFATASETNSILRITPRSARSTFATNVGIFPEQVEFGPGGVFGTRLYASSNQLPAAPDLGSMWTIGTIGDVTYFGTQTPAACRFGGGGIAFGSGGAFGTSVYTGSSGGDGGDCISRLPASGGTATLFSLLPPTVGGGVSPGYPGGIKFGPGTDGFGSDLYFAYWRTNGSLGFEDGIHRLTAAGGHTLFSPIVHPAEIEFGQGGVFGHSLYVAQTDSAGGRGRVLHVGADGVFTVLVDLVAGEAFGLAFADSTALYFTRTTGALGQLFRVFPASLLSTPATPEAPSFLRASPNPASRSIVLEWASSFTTDTEITAWSVDGRCVAHLANGTRGAGAHHVVWNIQDDSGRPLPPGVYFARLESAKEHRSCRFVVVH